MRRLILLFFLLPATLGHEAFGQVAVLPRGVGLVQYSYRNLSPQTDFYNGKGELESFSKANNQKLGLQSLLNETKFGSSLGALAGDNFLGDMNVAEIDVNAVAHIDVNIFAIGYGLTDFLTVYVGVPYVKAEVESSIAVKVNPELEDLRTSVGQILPGALGEKFRNTRLITATKVREKLAKDGYKLEDTWSHSGMGDMQVGLKSAFNRRMSRSALFNLGLSLDYRIPTGYVEDPNILNDSTLSEGGEGGYAGLTTGIQPGVVFFRQFYLGADLGYRYNFSATQKKRVPVAEEALPTQDRLTDVEIQPGSTKLARLNSRWTFGKLFAGYYLGYSKHDRDDITGPISGNYDLLEGKSERWSVYQGAQLGLQTIKAYEAKQFPIPLEAILGYHFTSSGMNANNDSYISLTLSTFFPTPFMRPSGRRAH